MRQGRGGWDFTRDVWEGGAIGIMFGAWSAEDVIRLDGEVDVTKVTLEWLRDSCPRPTVWLKSRDFAQVQAFLLKLAVGDGVVVAFDGALHAGVVTPGLRTYPGVHQGERIKCRPVVDTRRFDIRELPAPFRLLRSTGQQTIQRIWACAPYANLLLASRDARDVVDRLAATSTANLLGMLTPAQWETLCEEYLRDEVGYRSLLLRAGLTLPDVDLVGIDRNGRRVVAQCKNDPAVRPAATADAWARIHGGRVDVVFFFNRGGFSGEIDSPVHLVDGPMIAKWLESRPEYRRSLLTL
jgi:hypothetical protein